MRHLIFKKLFGPEAKNYSKYRNPYPKELNELLLKVLPEGSKSILDVGCGTGKSTEPLVETGLKVTGVDHDLQMIEEAKGQAKLKNFNIDYQVASAEQLPFSSESFDVITVGTAFHFFVNGEALAEIIRVLRPGGLLFIYWTLTTKEEPEEDSIPAHIFKKYDWIRVPPELRDLEHTSSVLAQTHLINIATKRISISYSATVEERVGLQTTSGFYETLSSEDKKGFLNDVRGALTQKLGNRSHFMLQEEIQVVYGFKQ